MKIVSRPKKLWYSSIHKQCSTIFQDKGAADIPSHSILCIMSMNGEQLHELHTRSEPPMPILMTSVMGLPVYPFHSPLLTFSVNVRIWARTRLTSGMTWSQKHPLIYVRLRKIGALQASHTYIFAIHHYRIIGSISQGNVQHGPILCEIDLTSCEHAITEFLDVASFSLWHKVREVMIKSIIKENLRNKNWSIILERNQLIFMGNSRSITKLNSSCSTSSVMRFLEKSTSRSPSPVFKVRLQWKETKMINTKLTLK